VAQHRLGGDQSGEPAIHHPLSQSAEALRQGGLGFGDDAGNDGADGLEEDRVANAAAAR
jgi:hypothetical protein